MNDPSLAAVLATLAAAEAELAAARRHLGEAELAVTTSEQAYDTDGSDKNGRAVIKALDDRKLAGVKVERASERLAATRAAITASEQALDEQRLAELTERAGLGQLRAELAHPVAVIVECAARERAAREQIAAIVARQVDAHRQAEQIAAKLGRTSSTVAIGEAYATALLKLALLEAMPEAERASRGVKTNGSRLDEHIMREVLALLGEHWSGLELVPVPERIELLLAGADHAALGRLDNERKLARMEDDLGKAQNPIARAAIAAELLMVEGLPEERRAEIAGIIDAGEQARAALEAAEAEHAHKDGQSIRWGDEQRAKFWSTYKPAGEACAATI